MSLVRLYIQHQKLILPTVAETEAGFFIDTAPVQVFEIADIDSWKSAMYLALVEGNKLVPTPERSDDPGSAILDKLDINKWSTFETSAVMYTLQTGGRYIHMYRTGKGADRMWSNDGMEQRQFASQAPLEVVVQAVAEDIIKQPEAQRPKTSLMLAPPSS